MTRFPFDVARVKSEERIRLKEVLTNWQAPDSARIPDRMHDSVIAWAVDYIRPGNFLMAVLQNDLVKSVGYADEGNAAALRSWATFVYNELPHGCWGSEDKCEAWIKKGIEEFKNARLDGDEADDVRGGDSAGTEA
jgi:hypothetical protein